MTALNKDRDTPERTGEIIEFPCDANVEIFAGSLVCTNADGFATPGDTSVELTAQGRAEQYVKAGAAAGDDTVIVKRGVFGFNNSVGPDAITLAHRGLPAFIVDDQTVAATDGAGTRSQAGAIEDVDDSYVWVRVGVERAGALLAHKALAELTTADQKATARSSIGARLALTLRIADLSAAGATRIVSPVAGRIASIRSVINGALATGNATLQAAVDGTNVVGGLITITQAGSAAGDVDSCTPTDDNDVAAGSVISLTVGGTNSAARIAEVTIEIAY